MPPDDRVRLVACPRSPFTWNYTIQHGDDVVAEVDISAWAEKGSITVNGIEHRVRREGIKQGDFMLQVSEDEVVRAAKPSAFRRRYVLRLLEREVVLESVSAIGRKFVLLHGEREIGSLAPAHLFTRRMHADLPKAFPLVVRVFLVWLVLILWRRAQDTGGD